MKKERTEEEKRDLKKVAIAVGAGVVGAIGIVIFTTKRGKRNHNVETSLIDSKFELFYDGICAFVEPNTKHYVATIETTTIEQFKDRAEFAFEYFKKLNDSNN